jgi:hypothetical protein
MASNIPVCCPNCGSVFPFHGFEIADGSSVGFEGIGTNCPICGFMGAKVGDGIYRATADTLELISGPDTTRAMLEALKLLAEQVAAGKIDKTEALARAEEISPKFAAQFKAFLPSLPLLALLIALLQTYLQYEGNNSSTEDMKKILDAVTGQTFVLKNKQNEERVERSSSHKTEPKTEPKSMSVKGPSTRRTDVNRERRNALKKHRKSHGHSRTR